MNGKYDLYGNNPMFGSNLISQVSEEQVLEPVDATETLETREEENITLPQEQVTESDSVV
jgi:hypothetical protein